MFDLIGQVLAFFYSVWPSYGMAIVFLTIAVMVVATPLTLKSTKSMLQMQRLQPELKAIQNRYKDDRQKMNEELMQFYQENGINPLGGCLPLLVQLPIFLVLFRVVQGVTSRATNFGNQFGWTSGRVGTGGVLDATTYGTSERPFVPQNLPEDSEMYQRLVGVDPSTGQKLPFDDRPTEMVSWGFDLSRTAQDVLGESLLSSLPYMLLIVIVLVSSLYQQRQIQGRSSGAEINPQQQMIMKVLPYMLPVFSFTMPAALVVYFVVSNLYRIGQQGYITHSLYKGDDSPGQQLARQRKDQHKGGGSKSGGDKGGGRTTPKKGEPTPKRDGSVKTAGGSKGNSRSSGSKNSGRKGSAGKGSAGKDSGKKASNSKGSAGKDSGKKASNNKGSGGSGAGRTGKAPTRHNQGGGRTTDPGSPQHKKRKK